MFTGEWGECGQEFIFRCSFIWLCAQIQDVSSLKFTDPCLKWKSEILNKNLEALNWKQETRNIKLETENQKL